MRVFDLVKKYRESSKSMVPRAVFMLLFFMIIIVFGSSIFMGVGTALSSVLAMAFNANGVEVIAFLAIELFFLFCVFVLQYGLFLSNLRFVRKQPVAISFLFTGFKQKRAKKFAAFFIVPIILSFVMLLFPVSRIIMTEIPQTSDPQVVIDYISTHPEILQKFSFHSFLFCIVCVVLYFPFTFVWSVVYDGTNETFKTLFVNSLKFWKGKVLKFLGFEIAAHYKTLVLIILCDVSQFIMMKNFSASGAGEIFSSIFGFASLFVTIVFFASIILSINFYYNEHVESDENPESESSN